jgi:predicted extracellular nuclease
MLRTIFINALLCVFILPLSAQKEERGDYRFMFYNVENLFDTIDQEGTQDEEFLQSSDKKWSSYRYWKKVNRIYQVIAAAGGSEAPEIIGLCEIENYLALYHLVNNTPLSKYPYQIMHRDSPDRRGIDVALLVRTDKAEVLSEDFLLVNFPQDSTSSTREIVYASLRMKSDTLHVFVNHWPSRWGGQIQSEPKRMAAAEVLAFAVDSLSAVHVNPKIVVTGDFNDEPENKSLTHITLNNKLINLSEPLSETIRYGTYKYKSQWEFIDQVLISPSLLKEERLYIKDDAHSIFFNDFLLQDDLTYGGKKPFRTYLGPRYLGGFSDHLPVLLDISFNSEE